MENEKANGVVGHPMVQGIYKSPFSAALASKLVAQPSNTGNSAIVSAKAGVEASTAEIQNASLRMQRDINDIENVFQLFPDMTLSSQIVVSSLLAPNNMFSQDFNLSIEHPLVSAELAGKVMERVKDELETKYGLISDLYDIAERALFKEGAVVRVVLPESAVDHLINNSADMRYESASGPGETLRAVEANFRGLLGSPRANASTFRFESFGTADADIKEKTLRYKDGEEELTPFITFTDNFSVMKEPMLREKAVQKALDSLSPNTDEYISAVKTRLETFDPRKDKTIYDSEFRAALFKTPSSAVNMFARVPDEDNLRRHSIGRPLYLDAPPECVLPVHQPGDPTKVTGAFFVLDKSGYFLSRHSQQKYINAAHNALNPVMSNVGTSKGGNGITSVLLEKAKANLKGTNDHVPLTYLAEIFGSLFEEDVIRRLQNGVMHLEASIASNNDAYMILMARAFAGQLTQVVYVPKKYFTYFAFQFNPDGTGRSMVTDVLKLLSMRGISMYAKIANQVRNAISLTEVGVELDPADRSPEKTLEMVKDIVSQSRTQFMPWGLNNPSDIANWWSRAGFQLNVSQHPRLPKVRVTYEQKAHDKNTPGIDDDEKLEDMTNMSLGITPEMRDAGKGANFATSIANSNILFSKRMHRLQRKYNTLLSDHARVIALNDTVIYKDILRLVTEHWADIEKELPDNLRTLGEERKANAIAFFTREMIETLTIKLPSPEITKLDQQVEAFENYKKALDAAMDAILSDDALATQILGDAHAVMVAYKEPLKAHMLRDWMRRENFMTELFELVEAEDGKPRSDVFDQIQSHFKGVAANINDFIKSFTPAAVAIAKDLKESSGETPADPDTTTF